jgi:CHASE1-domain containing sensor protein
MSKQTTLIFIVGIILTFSTFKVIENQERTAWVASFSQQVQREMYILQGRLDVNAQILLGTRSLYQASREVSLQDFIAYVGPILDNYGFIQALEWVPRVSSEEREGYEEDMKERRFSCISVHRKKRERPSRSGQFTFRIFSGLFCGTV